MTLINIFEITTCRKEFHCEKCEVIVKPKDVYRKYDNGFQYEKLCLKCYKRLVKLCIGYLKRQLKELNKK